MDVVDIQRSQYMSLQSSVPRSHREQKSSPRQPSFAHVPPAPPSARSTSWTLNQTSISSSQPVARISQCSGPRPLNHPPRKPLRAAPPIAESYKSWSAFSLSEIEASKWEAAHARKTWDLTGFSPHCSLPNIRALIERWGNWSLRKKLIVSASIAGFVLLWIIIIAAATSGSPGSGGNGAVSKVHVTNSAAFSSGGASHLNPFDKGAGTAGRDKYTYYSGDAGNFPDTSLWVAFDDMWKSNLPTIKRACSSLGYGPDNSESDNVAIRSAIQDTAQASLVDHRFILATVMQESNGCVSVGGTTSSGGVFNPGLMQSHNGSSYSPSQPRHSIYKMIHDGTQGTPYGDGLVQNLNKYGNVYKAARGYNSGSIAPSGDLSDANGATACYVSDIANRLTGWVDAPSSCTGY